MRIAIVGAGIMGLSAAWALNRDGHRVDVFEQGPVPNPLGSSVDRHRLTRRPYGTALGYMRMFDAAQDAWDVLWDDLGARHYVETGFLLLDRGAPGWVADSVAALTEGGFPCQRFEPDEIARAWPHVAVDGIEAGYLSPEGGALLAEKIVADLAAHLRRRGVEVNANTPVADVDPGNARLRLAGGGAVEADVVVIAAGPWLPRLLPAMAGRVTPSRQIVTYAMPPADLAEAWATSPSILDITPEVGVYVVPPVDGGAVKFGDHDFSMQGEPDKDREAGADEAARAFNAARPFLRDLDRYSLVEAKSCFYTVAPEERFIVEPLERAWVLSGFTGHGFKFAAAIGLRLADAIAERRTAADLTRWAAGR
jgi:glycine/D-amino acid oxidase-like deaminating enzyme